MRTVRTHILLLTLLMLLSAATDAHALKARSQHPDDFGYSLRPDTSSADASPVGSTALSTAVDTALSQTRCRKS